MTCLHDSFTLPGCKYLFLPSPFSQTTSLQLQLDKAKAEVSSQGTSLTALTEQLSTQVIISLCRVYLYNYYIYHIIIMLYVR